MTAGEHAAFLAAAPPGARLLVVPEQREHAVRVAMGGKVIFIHLCIFSVDNR